MDRGTPSSVHCRGVSSPSEPGAPCPTGLHQGLSQNFPHQLGLSPVAALVGDSVAPGGLPQLREEQGEPNIPPPSAGHQRVVSLQHVSSIIYRPGGAITIHNSRAVMFYKFKPAVWLPGLLAIFTSQMAFLPKRQWLALGALNSKGHPKNGRFWGCGHLSQGLHRCCSLKL